MYGYLEIEDGTDAALELAPIIARLQRVSRWLEAFPALDEDTLRAIDEQLTNLHSATRRLHNIAEDCFKAANADKKGLRE